MTRILRALGLAALLLGSISVSGVVNAQDLRYSWFELGVMGQDVGRTGTSFDPVLNQTVDISATDGSGFRFRGSVGTWNNLYAYFDFGTTDPTVIALVTNDQGQFPAEDEFDLTTIRGGIGYKYSLTFKTDIIAEISYESVDYDFGSFAGEDFDIDEQDVGGLLGIRSMFNDNFEIRAHARYTNVGDVNLTGKYFDSDVLFGVGLGYTLIRGLSVTVDYETGEIDTWSVGFRLDLDED
jgi:hypothetical protein